MSTRSLTKVNENGKPLVTMYRHCDGYPSGIGAELFEFLDGKVVINGIPMDPPEKAANGAGDLAAQLVASFKEGNGSPLGGVYLLPINAGDHGQEYEYIIDVDDLSIAVTVISTYGGQMFKGSVREFGAWLDAEAAEAA